MSGIAEMLINLGYPRARVGTPATQRPNVKRLRDKGAQGSSSAMTRPNLGEGRGRRRRLHRHQARQSGAGRRPARLRPAPSCARARKCSPN